jgi:hypothetical protein
VTFNELHGVIFQTTELFVTTAVRASNPKDYIEIRRVETLCLNTCAIHSMSADSELLKIIIRDHDVQQLWSSLFYNHVEAGIATGYGLDD